MKNTFLNGVLALVFLLASGSAHALTLGIPSYTYPGTSSDFWSKSSMVQAGTIYIANPSSGVGSAKDINYYSAIQNAHRHGVKVFGYIYTHYGNRAAEEIQQEAELYKSWYGVDGIFLDEAQLDSNHLAYYTPISKSISGLGLKVAFNPGQPQFDPHYLSLADHIVSFEGSYSAYQSASFPRWVANYPASKFWHMVYDVPNITTLEKTVNQAVHKHVGILFITNDSLPNPYDSVPIYWNREIKSLNGRR